MSRTPFTSSAYYAQPYRPIHVGGQSAEAHPKNIPGPDPMNFLGIPRDCVPDKYIMQ